MRYIYVDVGAYDGDTVDYFLNKATLPTCSCDFDIYAFEPNPNMDVYWRAITKDNKKVIYSQKAAYIDNGPHQFTVDTNKVALGSTLMKGKRNWGKGEIIDVECFDFSEWVSQLVDSYIIVKMDCEGAEFPILEKMIKDGTDEMINELWCEFHPNKVAEYTTDDKISLINRLKCGKVIEWH